ncbi:MAG: hypothetical protein ACRBN8_40575 [Nannocystales bacterium]
MATSPAIHSQWTGEGSAWDGSNHPDGEGYRLHYVTGGWVIEADLDVVSLVVPDPLSQCGSRTAEWAEHEEQASAGVFAAINANFFECDLSGDEFSGRSCPTKGERFSESGALAVEQFPIGVHCGDGNCFDNSKHSSAKYMSHLVVARDGGVDLVVYEGAGAPAEPPFYTPAGHTSPGAVADANIAMAVSGAPTLIRSGEINDSATGWSSLHYYEGLADSGTIPFVGVSYDRKTLYLGLVRGGARLAAQELLRVFPGQVEHAMSFDAGGSPSFWFKGASGADAYRKVPTKLGLASSANRRPGRGRSRCLDTEAPPPSPTDPDAPQPE